MRRGCREDQKERHGQYKTDHRDPRPVLSAPPTCHHRPKDTRDTCPGSRPLPICLNLDTSAGSPLGPFGITSTPNRGCGATGLGGVRCTGLDSTDAKTPRGRNAMGIAPVRIYWPYTSRSTVTLVGLDALADIGRRACALPGYPCRRAWWMVLAPHRQHSVLRRSRRWVEYVGATSRTQTPQSKLTHPVTGHGDLDLSVPLPSRLERLTGRFDARPGLRYTTKLVRRPGST